MNNRQTLRPSDATVARWGGRQAGVLASCACFAGAVAVGIISSGGNPALVAGVGAVAALFVVWIVFLKHRSASAHLPAGVLWVGHGEFDLDDLNTAHLADLITLRGKRRFAWWTQGRGVVGGRLSVLADEMTLTLGYFAKLAGASGTVHIPRSRVESLEIGHVPGTVVGKSGGGVSLHLEGGGRLDGRFLGSKPKLMQALSAWD